LTVEPKFAILTRIRVKKSTSCKRESKKKKITKRCKKRDCILKKVIGGKIFQSKENEEP